MKLKVVDAPNGFLYSRMEHVSNVHLWPSGTKQTSPALDAQLDRISMLIQEDVSLALKSSQLPLESSVWPALKAHSIITKPTDARFAQEEWSTMLPMVLATVLNNILTLIQFNVSNVLNLLSGANHKEDVLLANMEPSTTAPWKHALLRLEITPMKLEMELNKLAKMDTFMTKLADNAKDVLKTPHYKWTVCANNAPATPTTTCRTTSVSNVPRAQPTTHLQADAAGHQFRSPHAPRTHTWTPWATLARAAPATPTSTPRANNVWHAPRELSTTQL